MKTKSKAVNILVFVLLAVLALSFLYPLYYMFINSFKPRAEYMYDPFALPKEWSAESMRVMFGQFNILLNFKNTFIVAFGGMALITIVALFASYGFSKLRFRGSSALYFGLILTIMIPAQVTIIPMFTLYSKMGLVNTHVAVIMCYLAGGLPSAIMLITANFRSISNEMLEAASIDGCGYFLTVFRVVLPVGKTAIILNAVFNFIWYWNDLFTPTILLQKNEVKTVMVALATLVKRYAKEPAYQIAGLFIAAVPAIFVYIFFQKYIVKGISMGSIK